MSIAPPPRAVEPAFEVVAFLARPAEGGVAVLELRGRFTGTPSRHFDRARLRVERPAETAELSALHDAGEGAEVWSATFAVALDALQDATFALAIGRRLLLDLPAPDVQTPDGSPAADYVRLARAANHNRRQLLELRAALGAEQEARAHVQRHADELTGQRDVAVRERDEALAAMRAGLDELDAERARTAEETAQALAATQGHHDQALVDAQTAHEETLAATLAVHAQDMEAECARTAVAQANADDARAHADAARAELSGLGTELADARAAVFHSEASKDVAPESPPVDDAGYALEPESEPELSTLEAPPWASRMPQVTLPAGPRELLAAAAAPDNRPRTIALSVLAVAFFAFAAALGIGPL